MTRLRLGGPPLTLRRRLVLGIVALLAIASVVIGFVSVIALQSFLTGRLDDQLAAATSRSQGFADGGGDGGGPSRPPDGTPSGIINIPGQAEGTVTGIIESGSVLVAGYVDADGVEQALASAELADLLSLSASVDPQTVSLGELGDYRAIVDTTGDRTLITALPLSSVQAIVVQLVIVIGIVTLAAVALAALAGRLVVQVALRPLERVTETAGRVSELPLDRGEVALAERVPDADADPRTEVGQVGAAFNRMLGHVASALTARQQSEHKVRQFVADASHELRTPLASIRGYAELTRRGGHDLPPDVVHAIGRVESEARRMTSLVEDLLLLARLDEGRDLERRPVDLSRILIDAVSDAHAAGPDHEWSLDLPDEPVMVDGDDLRLHQVFTNLLANARVHTPAGSAVVVALSSEERAVVTVTDDGPGIPETQQPELFERFARGDSSRSRIAGSTGLGLAIVQAVVAGHEGTVSVSSEPGRTEFRVELALAH